MSDREQTCSSCRHYVAAPPDPADLAAPRRGECRCGPPALTLLPSPQGTLQLVGYPPLPPDFPACGRYEAPAPPPVPAGAAPWLATVNELAALEAAGQGDGFAAGELRGLLMRDYERAGWREREHILRACVVAAAREADARGEPAASH